MKKLIVLILLILSGSVPLVKSIDYPILAQGYSQVGILMWHDVDRDGEPDFVSEYVFFEKHLVEVDREWLR